MKFFSALLALALVACVVLVLAGGDGGTAAAAGAVPDLRPADRPGTDPALVAPLEGLPGGGAPRTAVPVDPVPSARAERADPVRIPRGIEDGDRPPQLPPPASAEPRAEAGRDGSR